MSQAKTVQKQKTSTEQKLEEIADLVKKAKAKKEAKALALFMALLFAAILGRVALQAVPSVEPIIPFAVLAGMIFGMKEGAMLGGTAYLVSNFFVWGLQGPWTIFQAIGAGLAGAIGGFFGKLAKRSQKNFLALTLLGTALFEVIMCLSGALMGIGLFGSIGILLIPAYIVTSLPFSALHIATNLGFAKLFSPMLKWRQRDEFKIVSVSRSIAGSSTNIRMYKSESK